MLRFALEDAVVFDFNRVHVVRIKTEDRHAAVRKELRLRNLVGDFLATLLRQHANACIMDFITPVAHYGSKRRHFVGIDDDFADIPR